MKFGCQSGTGWGRTRGNVISHVLSSSFLHLCKNDYDSQACIHMYILKMFHKLKSVENLINYRLMNIEYTNRSNYYHFIAGIVLAVVGIVLNPNWIGRGKSWPCRLWSQIAEKLIKYFIWKNTCSCRNIFRIFLNFWQDLKKWLFFLRTFWHTF